jgi:hypothetical protein
MTKLQKLPDRSRVSWLRRVQKEEKRENPDLHLAQSVAPDRRLRIKLFMRKQTAIGYFSVRTLGGVDDFPGSDHENDRID